MTALSWLITLAMSSDGWIRWLTVDLFIHTRTFERLKAHFNSAVLAIRSVQESQTLLCSWLITMFSRVSLVQTVKCPYLAVAWEWEALIKCRNL